MGLFSYKAPLEQAAASLLGFFQNGPTIDRLSNVTVEVGDNCFQWLELGLTSDMSQPTGTIWQQTTQISYM